MSQSANSISSRVIRWTLLILGAFIIGSVLVNSFALHMSYPHFAIGKNPPAIREKWHFASGPVTSALALADDGTLYAASEDGFVYALDPSGELQWKFEAGPMQASPVVGADGTIYVSNEDQLIIAIFRSGVREWAAGGGPYADKRAGSTAAAVDQKYLYTPWRGEIHAFRLTTGTIDWDAGFGYKNSGSISILASGVIVYPGVGRMDAAYWQGQIVWQYPPMDPALTTDMLLKNGGHPPQGNFWQDSGIAVGADGTLYTCATNSRLVALTSDGHFKWDFRTPGDSTNRATPVLASDGTIYFASGDGSLYALDHDGKKKWSLDTGGGLSATPVLAEDGTIYLLNGALMEISPEGKLLAQTVINGAGLSSPTLAPDGTVYVGSHAGMIYAFSGTHGGLMDSPWPKFQADLANSGRARPF